MKWFHAWLIGIPMLISGEPLQIVFLFYEGMNALDAVGPHEIICDLPGAKVIHAAKQPGLITTDSGLKLTAESALSDISHADILIIPGSSSATSLRSEPEILEWIRAIHRTTTWTASVCTGSLILGAAGVLEGKNATSHWAVLDRLPSGGALPVRQRVVQDGKVITAAGVSAGIDVALILSAKVAGREFAESMELGLEYDPDPPFQTGSPEKAPPKILEALRERLLALFEKP